MSDPPALPAIDPLVAAERGYRTITDKHELELLGFAPAQRRVPCLLLPGYNPDGSPAPPEIRPANPRPDPRKKDKPLKYEMPKGAAAYLDVHPRNTARVHDAATPLWITEGKKKGDAGVSQDLCMIALGGVGSFNTAQWVDIPLKGREVSIVYDSDIMTKVDVFRQLHRLREFLASRGAHVRVVYLPEGAHGTKQGLDDYFASGGDCATLERYIRDDLLPPRSAYPAFGGDKPHRDRALGERLVHLHHSNLRFVITEKSGGQWVAWAGTHWRDASDHDLTRLFGAVRDLMVEEEREARDTGNDERAKLLEQGRDYAESAHAVTQAYKEAKAHKEFVIESAAFDADPWLLNVANGTLDLRDGSFHDHRREDYLTVVAPVAYEPGATCPTFEAWLRRVCGGDGELYDFFQRYAGWTLTGLTGQRAFLLMHGSGGNGKSTLVNLFAHLLGPYAKKVSVDFFASVARDSYEQQVTLAALRKVRMVYASESEENVRLHAGSVKDMTGGERLSMRVLHKGVEEFSPQFSVWFSTNHFPRIEDETPAMWERLFPVAMPMRVERAEQRVHMEHSFRDEWPGILNWMLAGTAKWRVHGLTDPQCVTAERERRRADMDVIGQFVREQCVIAADAHALPDDLWHDFQTFARDNNYQKAERWGKNTFLSRLRDRYGLTKSRMRSEQGRPEQYRGIGLVKMGYEAAEEGTLAPVPLSAVESTPRIRGGVVFQREGA